MYTKLAKGYVRNVTHRHDQFTSVKKVDTQIQIVRIPIYCWDHHSTNYCQIHPIVRIIAGVSRAMPIPVLSFGNGSENGPVHGENGNSSIFIIKVSDTMFFLKQTQISTLITCGLAEDLHILPSQRVCLNMWFPQCGRDAVTAYSLWMFYFNGVDLGMVCG